MKLQTVRVQQKIFMDEEKELTQKLTDWLIEQGLRFLETNYPKDLTDYLKQKQNWKNNKK